MGIIPHNYFQINEVIYISNLYVSAYSYIGTKYHINQDNLFINGIYNEKSLDLFEYDGLVQYPCVVAVYDGIGGLDKGELASLCCSKLTKLLFDSVNNENLDENKLRSYYNSINETLVNYERNHSLDFGSTAAICIVNEKSVLFSNLGDSRIYCFKNDVLEQMSKDHNDAQITDSKYGQGLTQYLGFDTSEYRIEPHIVHKSIGLSNDEYILLCSDGVYKYVSDEEIIKILKTDSINISKALVEKALENGSTDNITTIVMKRENNIEEH